MTSQKDQIQALITDIDSVLQKTTPRLPWVVSGEMTQQRQILERVRNYLVTFQRRQIAGEGFEQAGARPDLLAHDIYYQPSPSSYQPQPVGSNVERSQAYGQSEVAAQQMLQALVQDMGYLRSQLMQPLQSDVEALRQQREALAQEIRQLEGQRQSYVGQVPGNQQQVIAEFLQALMNRLQETLPQQVAQTLRSVNQQPLPYGTNLALTGSAPAMATTSDASSPGVGPIQAPPSQSSDELLIKLDSTLSVVFESLQRNVQAYEESLSQGLNKMHSLGQQGEMMFTALISHLANQLGQEASSYLQPSAATRLESLRTVSPSTGPTSSMAQAAQPPRATVSQPPSEQPDLYEQQDVTAAAQPLTLPFPGTELSSSVGAAAPASADSEPSVDTAIETWLRSAGSADGESTVELEIAELNLEGFDLNQLAVQDVNALLELDANLLGTNLPPQPMLAPEPFGAPVSPIAAEPASSAMSVEDTADIDAALKLLEQLSSELQDQPASVADADAQIDRMLSTPSTLPAETAPGSIPDDAKDELDEFYESLFGNQAIAAEPSTAELTTVLPATLEAAPVVEVDKAVQALSTPITGPEPAIAPAAAQPVDTLPAETQAPPEVMTATEIVAPTVSTAADPTLGWDMSPHPVSTHPLSDQSAEPEIPEALLDDELLSGWDLDDTEAGLTAVEMAPAGDDALGLGETTAASDRAPGLSETSVALPSDAATLSDAATVLSEPHPLSEEPISQALMSGFPVSTEASAHQDEITTLTDLLVEATPPEGLPSEAPSAALPATPSEPPVTPLADVAPVVLPVVSPVQMPPAAPEAHRPPADRYTPASPEEDLLPLQETDDEPDPELWLDESTLNRLSADLFSLEEAIGNPSILPYGTEPEAADSTRPSEATATDESASLGESIVPEELMSLADWNTSLGEVADVPPPTDSTPVPPEPQGGAIAAEAPEAFILEGMDDLFANTPAAPPVTPAAPPVSAQAEPSTAFTLEGMNDLFGDSLASPAPLPSTPPPTDQPLPFTLEGMDDLFGDVPVVTPAPMPASPPTGEQPLPFTLEGVDSLFADVPPVTDVTPVVPAVANPAISLDSSEPVSAFSLEQVGDLFVEMPTVGAPTQNFSREESIAPSTEPLPEATSEPAIPFTLEQVGDLFMEMPTDGSSVLESRATEIATTLPDQETESASTPFTLEQVGDLFVETPSGEARLDPLTISPILQSPSSTAEPSIAEPPTLEQAFASLMGTFDESSLPLSAPEPEDQDPEKKNGMS